MTHLLLVSLGPVQEFIASARRCRDLWFGSWLLSELGKAAVEGIRSAGGPTVEPVFPATFPGAPTKGDIERSVANKILVRLVDATPDQVRLAAEEGRRHVESRLQSLGAAVFERVKPARYLARPQAEAQLDDLIEYVWVAVPETDGYAAARAKAESLLQARKASKGWSQPSWGAVGARKSSLDGLRESVLHESLFEAGREKGLLQRLRLHPKERLCGVGLLKRLGERSPEAGAETFFSTSHLAAVPWMKGHHAASPDAVASAVDAFRARAHQLGTDLDDTTPDPMTSWRSFGRLDGAAFFPERLVEMAEEQEVPTAEHPKLRDALSELRRALPGEPGAYYAVLLADGDRMGAAIDALKTFAQHQALSTALETFAAEAGRIVAKHDGSLIYSGGDDVLALMPLDTALPAARALREAFLVAVAPVVAGLEVKPTLSVGLGIVHHIEPMSEGLDAARHAERLAKDNGRNALAVSLRKRAGAPLDVVGRWGAIDERLETFIAWSLAGDLSAKASHELQQLESLTRGVTQEADRTALREIQRLEFQRIVGRKNRVGGDAPKAPHVDFSADLFANVPPAELGRELQVAREIAHARRLARPELASSEVAS